MQRDAEPLPWVFDEMPVSAKKHPSGEGVPWEHYVEQLKSGAGELLGRLANACVNKQHINLSQTPVAPGFWI